MEKSEDCGAASLPELARDAFRHGTGTLIVKGVRVAQEILIASVLAVAGSMDGWLAAYALCSVPVNLLLHAFQPPLVAELARSRSSLATIRRVIRVTLLVGLVSACLVALFGSAWFRAVLGSVEARSAALQALPLLAFYTYVGSINVALNGALQARGKFFAAGLIPVAAPAAIIVFLLVVPERGVRALALGLAAGSVIEMVLAWVSLIGSSWSEAIVERAAVNLRSLLGDAIVLLPGVACAALVPLVEQYFASRAGGVGGVAVLGYAQRLPYFLVGTLSLSLSAVGTTSLARLSVAGPVSRAVIRRAGLWVMIASGALVIPLVLGTRPLTRWIFERGAFGPEATSAVAAPMAILLLGLPFSLLRLFALRSLTVARRNSLAASAQALGLLIVVALNVFFLQSGLGVSGVAAATSLALLVSGGLAWLGALRSPAADSSEVSQPRA